MKSKKLSSYFGVLLVFFAVLFLGSCTKDFESINTDSNGITNKELQVDFNNIGQFFPAIQQAFKVSDIHSLVSMDVGYYLGAGTYGGYFMKSYGGGQGPDTYTFTSGVLNEIMFNDGYNNLMAPINNVALRGARVSAPTFWAIALILQVAGMQKITDMYGPIPYSQFGKGGATVSYDNQESIYNLFFLQLDTAMNTLKNYMAANPNATPFAKFDVTYGGSFAKWLKLANSLRLRLALQIVKVDPSEAKLQAEKAVDPANGGVLTSNSDNAMVSGGLYNLEIFQREWQDSHANAAIISYMSGYHDPRLSEYFDPSTIVPGEYVGLRTGGMYSSGGIAQSFSKLSGNFTRQSPYIIMTAAEVYFLRAEGALRGWNMGGAPEDLYNKGIETSFGQWGVGSAAGAYISDDTSMPANYVDPSVPANSINRMTTIPIAWMNNATQEQNLEQIITQEWVADFPDGPLAWDLYRRTGYPKLFPTANNFSGGTVNTAIQIRRLPYPPNEYENNNAAVTNAVNNLLGGPDNGGTRVWWDVNKGNF
ncbi:MAG: SusD/RagB family nutrient-binding outer membrane lipoprotein [Chitinophagaceae bacterium]|nr:MAG: SusD/RagB family nutrient-binding outer membrane lipoprotein [Chitinophagaceae bacterium]